MRRLVAVLGLVAAMVLSGASVALAHERAEQTPALENAFNSEPLLKAAIGPNGHANENALPGIFQGFVVHAPTCAGHPSFH